MRISCTPVQIKGGTYTIDTLRDNPYAVEYFLELNWQKEQLNEKKLSTYQDYPLLSAAYLYVNDSFDDYFDDIQKNDVTRNDYEFVVITKKTSDETPDDCIIKPIEFTNTINSFPDSHGLLALVRPYSHRYGDFHFYKMQPNMWLQIPLLIDHKDNVYVEAIYNQFKVVIKCVNLTSDSIASNVSKNKSAVLEKVRPIQNLNFTKYKLAVFIINPFTESSNMCILTSLKTKSHCEGYYSPLSPLINQNESKSTQQIIKTNDCPVHNNLKATTEATTNCVKLLLKIHPNLNKPLSVPALCSCLNEELRVIWVKELELHKSSCFSNQFSYSKLSFNEVNFSSLINNNSTITFNFLSKALENLHYCLQCGGLQYIPYSFVEVSLNREVPSITGLVKILPLPISTEMFSDNMKLTVCLTARNALHEWFIIYALSLIKLHKCLRVFSVCSYFLSPYFKCNEKNNPQTNKTQQCILHNLIQRPETPNNSYFINFHLRRSYCLNSRDPHKLSDFNGSPPENLSELCFNWLQSQTFEKKEVSCKKRKYNCN